MAAKKKPSRRDTPRHLKSELSDRTNIVKIVRAGVERFILKDAPIGEFRKAIRLASKKGEISSHPLTGAIFRRIVHEAIKERKRRIGAPKENSTTMKRKRSNAKTANRDH